MLRITTFGGLPLSRDGIIVTGPAVQRRRLALLALLAPGIGDRGLSRDKAAALLWPESDESSARNSLKQSLSVLRRELATDLLVAGAPDLRLNPAVISSDVREFDVALGANELERAVELHRGVFLDGFHLGADAEEFERWTDEERDRLLRQFTGALERLADAAGKSRQLLTAVAWWRRLAATDSLNTRYTLRLIETLLAAGDRAAATKQANVHAEALRRELGLEPDPAIRLTLQAAAKVPPMPGMAAPMPSTASASNLAAHHAPRRLVTRRAARIGILALLILSAAGLVAIRGRPARTISRVAVLPFANLGAPEDASFALGLTDELTTMLAARSGLEVVSQSSAARYARSSKTAQEIGRELQADYVLDGGVLWHNAPLGGSRVRITPKLIRVIDDRHVWADVLESDVNNLFELQTRVAELVAKALNARFRNPLDSISHPPTANIEAYRYYLRGVGYLDQFDLDSQSIQIAIQLHSKAVELDSSFALAWARLSMSHSWLYWRGYDATPERAAAALAAAESARRLQHDLPETHLALASYYGRIQRDYRRGLEESQRAYAARPFDGGLLMYMGSVELRIGRYRQAAEHLRRATLLDPLSSHTALLAGLAHAIVREYSEADRHFERAVILQPDWAITYAARAQLQLAWRGDTAQGRAILRQAMSRVSLADVLGHMGYFWDVGFAAFLPIGDSRLEPELSSLKAQDFSRFPSGDVVFFLTKAYIAWIRHDRVTERAYSDSARVLLETRTRGDPKDDMPDVWLALARAGVGDSTGAMAAAEQALATMPVQEDPTYSADRGRILAQLYLRIGDGDRAVAELERLLSGPSTLSLLAIKVDPTWNGLRGNERFDRLLRSSNF